MRLTAGARDAGQRLDRVLCAHLPEYTRSRLQQWIEAGRVLLGDAKARASQTVREGDVIEVEPAAAPPLAAEAEDIPLSILYEDDDLVAVDKPAGMVVHAGAGVHRGTLVNALVYRFAALSGVGGALRPGIVHRLDRFTSGVILVAKTDAAHQALAAQFAGRKIEKHYLALLHGRLEADSGRVERPIARDPVHRTRMTARLSTGRPAWSEYTVLRRFERFTYADIRIGTGRTHQIRVHMASIGHPVVGDALYGAPVTPTSLPPLGRFFLHAHRIRFLSPGSGQPLEIVSPLPPELAAWMEALPPRL